MVQFKQETANALANDIMEDSGSLKYTFTIETLMSLLHNAICIVEGVGLR